MKGSSSKTDVRALIHWSIMESSAQISADGTSQPTYAREGKRLSRESTQHAFENIAEESEDNALSHSELFEKVFTDTSKDFQCNTSAQDGPRRYSAPVLPNPALQRSVKLEPPKRPHSVIMLNESHHIYDVPRLRPKKLPCVFVSGKPQLPPKEKRYSVS